MQYVRPEETFYIDILTRLGEAFQLEDLEVERLDFDGLVGSVVTPTTRYRIEEESGQNWRPR